MSQPLRQLVIDKIKAIGEAEALNYFGVASKATISAWLSGKNDPPLAAAQKVLNEMPDNSDVEIAPPEYPDLRGRVSELESALASRPDLTSKVRELEAELNEARMGILPASAPMPEPPKEEIKILVPMMDRMEPKTFLTLVGTMKRYGMEKCGVMTRDRTLIVEARNDLAQRAMQSKAQWFVFVDADMVFPCGNPDVLVKQGYRLPQALAAQNALTRLMSHPADKLIVGALYKDRRGGTRAQCEIAFRDQAQNERLLGIFSGKTPPGGLEKTVWVGFGMVRIHRSVFARMMEAAKSGGPLAEIAPPPGRDGEPFGFFDTSRARRGEDVSFCRRAEKIGIETWVDTGLCLGHVGTATY